jgi:hypothetical protein
LAQELRPVELRIYPDQFGNVADLGELKLPAAGVFGDLNGEHEQGIFWA